MVVGAVVALQTFEHHRHDRRSESLEQLLAHLDVLDGGVTATELPVDRFEVVEPIQLTVAQAVLVLPVALDRRCLPKEQQVGLVGHQQVVAGEAVDAVLAELDGVGARRSHGDEALPMRDAVREVQPAAREVRGQRLDSTSGDVVQGLDRCSPEQLVHVLHQLERRLEGVGFRAFGVHGGVGGASGALGCGQGALVLLVVGGDLPLQRRDGAVEPGDLLAELVLLVAQSGDFRFQRAHVDQQVLRVLRELARPAVRRSAQFERVVDVLRLEGCGRLDGLVRDALRSSLARDLGVLGHGVSPRVCMHLLDCPRKVSMSFKLVDHHRSVRAVRCLDN